LCEDCAEEVRRLEKLADELTAMPGCEERQAIVARAETTAGLVNRLRAHDRSPCSDCAALRRRAAIASETSPAMPRADGRWRNGMPSQENLTQDFAGAKVETKFLRLFRPAVWGERIDGWQVCWLGGWDRQRIVFVAMVKRIQTSNSELPCNAVEPERFMSCARRAGREKEQRR
jgi:hypothetical protein